MSLPSEEFTWFGHGWFAGQTSSQAAQNLLVVAIVGAILIAVSYRYSIVRLGRRRWSVLVLLRLSAWLVLLAILAGPTHIRRSYDRPARTIRPLALLVDRSESMQVPDNRGQRRLDDALIQWKRVAAAATASFESISTFAFAQDIVPTGSADETVPLHAGRTDLFSALHYTLAQQPEGGWGGIVVLTDGVDNSGAEVETARRALASEALKAGTPLYFVVGRNRLVGAEFLRLKEFNVPAKTVPNSLIRLNAIFESSRGTLTTLPVELLREGQARPAGSLRLEAGRHMETWTGEARAEAPGLLVFELRAGHELARAEVRIEPPPANRLLYLQGRLDWSYRFVMDALSGKDAPRITPLIEGLPEDITPPAGAISAFPSEGELSSYGFIVIDQARVEQLTPERQIALARWVSAGGVLIFIAGEPQAVRHLAGSELEKLLPVVFAAPAPVPLPLRAAAPAPESKLARPSRAELTAMAWENAGRVREIFGESAEPPAFVSWVPVARAKPGAEVLARHPTEKGSDGEGAILLAVQPYGRKNHGFRDRWTVALASAPGERRGGA